MDLPLAIQSYKQDSLPISAQRCVNAYAEFQPPDAKTRVSVNGSAGIAEFGTLGTGPIRALFEMNDVGYAVSGSDFYTFDEDGNGTVIGAGISGNDVVSIDGSGFQIAIVNSDVGYTYTLNTGVFAQITDPDFFPANTVKVVNLYFVYDKIDSNEFFISNLLDATAYDAFDIASGEANPDRVRAVNERNGVILVMGSETIELWDNTGATDFPFQRFKGGTINRGLKAPKAMETEEDAIFFLGDDLGFYLMSGTALRRISTTAIEKEWATYAMTADAFCFKISYGGHVFIHITFPTAQKTWAVDITSNYLWHERQSYDPTGLELRWRANSVCNVYGKQIVGDARSGRIGYIDPTINTEWGERIVMSLTTPNIHDHGNTGKMARYEIDLETGVGTLTGQGADPQIMLDWSDDGGEQWSQAQLWQAMGKISRRQTRVAWTELGEFDQRVMRIRISDPVKRRIIASRSPFLYFEQRG